MRKLNVRGTIYNYPENGEDRGAWGNEAVDWAEAVTDNLDLIIGANDILQTSFSIENNIALDTIIRGLYFNANNVSAAEVLYSIKRTTDTQTVSESGVILIQYEATAPSTERWKMTQQQNGDAQVVISIDDLGQFYYQSSNLTGTNYSGTMKFLAKTLST